MVGTTCNTTSDRDCSWSFGLGCTVFDRPTNGISELMSVPPPTKMFRFGEFPLRVECPTLLRLDGKSYWGIPGSTAACGLPGLFAACDTLRRWLSRAIHHSLESVSSLCFIVIFPCAYPVEIKKFHFNNTWVPLKIFGVVLFFLKRKAKR